MILSRNLLLCRGERGECGRRWWEQQSNGCSTRSSGRKGVAFGSVHAQESLTAQLKKKRLKKRLPCIATDLARQSSTQHLWSNYTLTPPGQPIMNIIHSLIEAEFKLCNLYNHDEMHDFYLRMWKTSKLQGYLHHFKLHRFRFRCRGSPQHYRRYFPMKFWSNDKPQYMQFSLPSRIET